MRESDLEPESGAPEGDWVDRFILVFVHESMLWPILVVIIGHVVVFTAPALLLALRDGRASAFAALLLLGFFSVQIVRFDLRRSGRLGALSALVTVVWVLSVALAWVAHETGIF